MKFVENQSSDDTLDLACRVCPLHLLEPGDKLNYLKKGQVLVDKLRSLSPLCGTQKAA